MELKSIRYTKENGVGIITIYRPEARNAINAQVREEIYDVLVEAETDPEVGGLIITGGPDVFSGGADIKAMAEQDAISMFYRKGLQRVVEMIEKMPKPVIAAISGFALGGGCELALGCDLRIASESAQMGQPEIRLGIIPGGGGTQRLARLVGVSKAKDLIFSGRIINAQEALQIGLVNEVVPVEQLAEAAMKKMQSYLRNGAVALAAAKLSINAGLNVDLYAGDLFEKLSFSILFASEDQKEGMKAFIEKRKAEFKGK